MGTGTDQPSACDCAARLERLYDPIVWQGGTAMAIATNHLGIGDQRVDHCFLGSLHHRGVEIIHAAPGDEIHVAVGAGIRFAPRKAAVQCIPIAGTLGMAFSLGGYTTEFIKSLQQLQKKMAASPVFRRTIWM